MTKLFKPMIIGLLAMLVSTPALAVGAQAPHLDGGELALIWVVPFVCMLLSIAVFPLVAPHFWHHNFGKIAGFWAVMFIIPFTIIYGFGLGAL